MKFLLDECLTLRLRDLLEAAGHDAVHVVERNLQGKTDDEVMNATRQEGRVLLSADTDFGELHARHRATTPSVILFRRGNRMPDDQAATLLQNLDAIAADLEAGSIVVFTDDRLRLRRLPI